MTQFSRNTNSDFTSDPQAPLTNGAGGGMGEGPRRNPLLALWHRRWIIVITTLLAVTIASVRVYRAPRIWQAAAQITVDRTGPRMINNDPSEVLGQAQNYLTTQCEVLRSRKILQKVAEDPTIAAMPTFEGMADNIVGYLKAHVFPSVGRRDDIITIAVKGPYPTDAAAIANAVVDAYKADLENQKRSSIRDIITFYSKEKSKVEANLKTARALKLAFQHEHPDLALGSARMSPADERVSSLQAALTQTQLAVIDAQGARDATAAMATDPQRIRQLLDSRQFKSENADLRRQMRELQQRFAAVGKTYLPNFPDVGLLQTSIKQLEHELQDEDKKIFDAFLAELDARLATEKNREAQLQAKFNQAKAEAHQLYILAETYSVRDTEVQSLEKYDSDLMMRIRELTPLSDDAMANVNEIETARGQDAALVEPDVSMTMFLGLGGGLLLGAVLAIVRDMLDQRLRSAEEIKQATGLAVLGVVPHIQGANSPSERALQLHTDPMSDVAESYRTIRTAVYFGAHGGTAKTLLITSPSPGEGKSTLASNLAIAMAQAGNRILLLDADFRRPTLHKIFEIERNIGLSNVLAGKQELADAIRPTKIAGLDVLACGPIPANPSEILNSQMFADVLHQLSEQYDHVLLDSPPVMPVTDARILAASCDATLLAVRAEKTARKAAIFGRDVLRSVGARLLGVVVNDVPRRKGLYGYYYSESQLYHYGYGTPTRARTDATPATGATNGNGSHATGEASAAGEPKQLVKK